MSREIFKNLPDTSTPLSASKLNGVFNGEESMGSIVVEDVTCKNLCSGVSQGYYITTAGTSFGRTATDNGLVIEVEENKDYTISTTDIQTRYRIAFTNTLLSVGGSSSDVYNALTKDGTSDSITRNSGAYKYLIVNATDLTKIQVEKGKVATGYVEHKEFDNAPTTLWTNANHVNDFANQVVNLSYDISNFKYYEIVYKIATDYYNYKSTGKIPTNYAAMLDVSMSANFIRTTSTPSGKTLTIGDALKYTTYNMTSTIVSNNALIPIQILGYK